LGVTPAADVNIMKITENCLFVRSSAGRLWGGRFSISWWAVASSIFCSFLFLGTMYLAYLDSLKYKKFAGNLFEYAFTNGVGFLVVTFILPVCFSWMFVLWRRHELPIIFNRKTGKVTCLIQKWIAVQDWANLKAYVKDLTSVQGGGAPANEGILTLEFPWLDQDGKNIGTLSIPVYGTVDAPEAVAQRAIYGAAMIWEYIRLYMREGKDALPPVSHMAAQYRISNIRESYKEFNITQGFIEIFKRKFYWWPLSITSYFLFVLPFCLIGIPADMIYLWLDKTLPRRKWPKELLEACDHTWDGSY
jgi:hypothetical protein